MDPVWHGTLLARPSFALVGEMGKTELHCPIKGAKF